MDGVKYWNIKCNFTNKFQITQTNIETQVSFSFSKCQQVIILDLQKSQTHLITISKILSYELVAGGSCL
jgi:hypothetical protein